ncbi:MAG: trypsin-like serine protease, partial [Thermoleophilaceae bacterium]|nr:trypsin-like serine protease [Thermoleophilaceae bacterium]
MGGGERYRPELAGPGTHRVLVVSLVACAVLVSAAPAGAIVGGGPATDTGSTVAIRIEKKTGGSSCTGTLVARSVVLTAAHCVEAFGDPDLIRIRVLAGLLDRATAPAAPNDFIVTRVQESRDFDKGSPTTKPSDIAYLELGRNATQTPSSMSYDRPKAGADG